MAQGLAEVTAHASRGRQAHARAGTGKRKPKRPCSCTDREHPEGWFAPERGKELVRWAEEVTTGLDMEMGALFLQQSAAAAGEDAAGAPESEKGGGGSEDAAAELGVRPVCAYACPLQSSAHPAWKAT
jgi:hypothetical protein